MMSTMTAISVRRIRSLLIGQQTGMVTKNTRVINASVKTVLIFPNAPESKEHEKVINRHIWEEYLETSEDIRHTLGNKEIYMLRKETIERLFGSAKEQHGFRYTQYIGNARMNMKAGLTFACMNLKKAGKNSRCKGKTGQKIRILFYPL